MSSWEVSKLLQAAFPQVKMIVSHALLPRQYGLQQNPCSLCSGGETRLQCCRIPTIIGQNDGEKF
jgi:hypothetical protein